MNSATDDTANAILDALNRGEPGAADRLLLLMYDELRLLAGGFMAGERRDHTLQATALVHEAYIRLVGGRRSAWKDLPHFRATAAVVMRHILRDHAKARRSIKRGGGRQNAGLDEQRSVGVEQRDLELMALDEAMSKLQGLDDRQYKVAELRFFGGLTVQETALQLQIAPRTVEAHWAHARVWLQRELTKGDVP